MIVLVVIRIDKVIICIKGLSDMIRMTYSKLSECGPVRKINQDSVLALVGDDVALFCIADGMGGYSEGEKASAVMIEAINKYWNDNRELFSGNNMGIVSDGLEKVISDVNTELFEYGKRNAVCGTTVSLLCLFRSRYFVLSVGDSRIYLRKNRDFSQITVDEIWSNRWITDSITGKRLPDPKYGQLLNAVGTDEKISVMKSCGTLTERMVFLLCSDGLYKFCTEKDIKKAIKYKKKPIEDKRIAALKKIVEKNGEKDNLSVIMIKIDMV